MRKRRGPREKEGGQKYDRMKSEVLQEQGYRTKRFCQVLGEAEREKQKGPRVTRASLSLSLRKSGTFPHTLFRLSAEPHPQSFLRSFTHSFSLTHSHALSKARAAAKRKI